MKVKIKPVLRYPGSKFKKLDKIMDKLYLDKDSKFLDMFAGSGIVGVNVRNKFNNEVIINDFDKVLPIEDKQAITNICSFQGLGTSFPEAANKMAITRIDNGYWDKVDIYNEELNKCKIISYDWFKDSSKFKNLVNEKRINTIYVDPPYDDIKGLYKKGFTKQDHIDLEELLSWATTHNVKILISYNDTEFIRELYSSEHWHIDEEEYQYQTGRLNSEGKKKKVNELFITNFKGKE